MLISDLLVVGIPALACLTFGTWKRNKSITRYKRTSALERHFFQQQQDSSQRFLRRMR